MSKLYNMYNELKKQDSDFIYLFKSGIFYIALDQDAYTLSKFFNFKITNFNDTIVKCGFPCTSLQKYSTIFNAYNLKIKIIENTLNTSYDFKDYSNKIIINKMLDKINSIDINSLSVKEAFSLIECLQENAKQIK